MKLNDVLSRLSPKEFARRFPAPEMEKRFTDALTLTNKALEGAEENAVEYPTHDIAEDINAALNALRDLYSALHPATEIASKARLNEVVVLGLSEYVERSIYLAGAAEQSETAEPYRTQIANQPVHACLFRYRQAWRIEESLTHGRRRSKSKDVEIALSIIHQMKRSLLSQAIYFANRAFIGRSDHPLSAYHKALCSLLLAYEHERMGQLDGAARLEKEAHEIVIGMAEPSERTHFAHIQYNSRHSTQFREYRRLSTKHEAIARRFDQLSMSAEDCFATRADTDRECHLASRHT